MAHEILPDEDDPYLEIGRFLSTRSYPRARRRELSLPGIKIDLIESGKEGIVVVEVKKSSRFLEAARLQLLFYLAQLEEKGVRACGELRIPAERRRFLVKLDEEGKARLHEALRGLTVLVDQPLPPLPRRIPFCRRCAYRGFCWAGGSVEERT